MFTFLLNVLRIYVSFFSKCFHRLLNSQMIGKVVECISKPNTSIIFIHTRIYTLRCLKSFSLLIYFTHISIITCSTSTRHSKYDLCGQQHLSQVNDFVFHLHPLFLSFPFFLSLSLSVESCKCCQGDLLASKRNRMPP